MVILAAKLTDAPFRVVERRIGPGGIGRRQDRRSYVCTRGSPRLSSSLEVLRGNLIVALIIAVFGFHLFQIIEPLSRIYYL